MTSFIENLLTSHIASQAGSVHGNPAVLWLFIASNGVTAACLLALALRLLRSRRKGPASSPGFHSALATLLLVVALERVLIIWRPWRSLHALEGLGAAALALACVWTALALRPALSRTRAPEPPALQGPRASAPDARRGDPCGDTAAALAAARGELEHRVRELEHARDDMERLTSILSHDIRSPLRGIALVAEWLASDQEQLDPEGRDHVALLQQRTARMLALVDGLLDYVRAGSQREPREELCIQEILEEVLAGLSRSPEVHIELSEELMELTGVVYPRSDLHQVFANLIDNAFSHMGRAGRVRVSGRGTFEGYEFRVADDGVGIPVEHQPQVFRLFEKIPASAPTASVGAGLAIAKKIVERNGGEIRLEPVARGTTIVFSVPRGEPVLPPALEKARLERCI